MESTEIKSFRLMFLFFVFQNFIFIIVYIQEEPIKSATC